MEWSGFALLILVGVGIISTGLPAAFILITVATLGAVLGIATGTIPFALLWALPGRLINLFENDLLQALPLYVTMGLLLGRLPVADALYRTSNAILPRARIGAARLRHAARRAARADERLGRRQRARPLARGGAAAHRRGRAGGDARRHHRGCLDARRSGAAVAGAHPAQRRDARARTPTRSPRPAAPTASSTPRISSTPRWLPALIFIVLSLALAWLAGRGQPLPHGKREPLHAARGDPRRRCADRTAGSARRRRHRLFLRRRSRRGRRLHAALRRPRHRTAAAAR